MFFVNYLRYVSEVYRIELLDTSHEKCDTRSDVKDK